MKTDSPAGSGQFQPTKWAVVLSLREKNNPKDSREALEILCHDYWYPLYAYARRSGKSEHDAQDLTQGFFGYLLEKDLFSSADPALGKLRTFLMTAFTRYMTREWHSSQAQKRGGGRLIESLDEEFEDGDSRYRKEPADALTPERLFARSWAQSVMQQAKQALMTRESAAGKGEMLRVLEPFLEGRPEGELSYRAAAQELAMSEEAVRKAVSRFRLGYREAVRAQIAATLKTPTEEEIEMEMRSLWAALVGQ